MFAHKKSSLFNATQPIVCVFFFDWIFYVFPTQKTMLNVCKVPLNACGVDASSKEKAEQSNIWDFVVARLASMRADSCTA
ncbi:MAG: hypothetical protein IJV78_02185, partial [Clostridia bacterium]|nr:hypothetical protein [Clostridia bacterium]